jgi:parvulin-like peptidyl-prolyl isomerase
LLRKTILLSVSLVLLFAGTVFAQDYTIPEPPDDVEPDLIVAEVGDETLVLDEFAQRIRYRRMRTYRAFQDLVSQAGEAALDTTAPDNQFAQPVQQILDALANDEQIGQSVYDTLILEYLYHQEAAVRGIEIDQCEIDTYWATLVLGLVQEVTDCQMPEGFEEAQAEFYAQAADYAGMSQAQVDFSIVAPLEYAAVQDALRQEAEVDEIGAVRTRHIRVATEDTANEIIERYEAGDEFDALLDEYTLDTGVQGNAGELGILRRDSIVPNVGQSVLNAAFAAEDPGLIGPVESEFGWHVIEVNESVTVAEARHILVETEAEANQVLSLLDDGAGFGELARRFSIDGTTRNTGGNLGTFTPQDAVPEFSEAVFSAEIGTIVGPVETEFGWHIIDVIDVQSGQLIDVRHILLETEDAAQAVIERLEAGEDFNTVAIEVSVDPSAAGNRGDTLALVTGNERSGLYVPEETVPQFDEVVFRNEAQEGDLLGPVAAGNNWFVILLEEKGTRIPGPADVELAQRFYVRDWETAQFGTGRVVETAEWRNWVPFDPLPSEFDSSLATLDARLLEAREAYLANQAATTIPNILDQLESPEAETTPEAQSGD